MKIPLFEGNSLGTPTFFLRETNVAPTKSHQFTLVQRSGAYQDPRQDNLALTTLL